MLPRRKRKLPTPRFDKELSLPEGVKYLRSLQGHVDFIGRIAWSPDGTTLASPSADGTVRLWNTEDGQCMHKLVAHGKAVYSAAFDSTGQLLATASGDGTIRLWDVNGQPLRTFQRPFGGFLNVAIHPNNQTIIGTSHGEIIHWEIASGQAIYSIKHNAVFSATFDPSGNTIIGACHDRSISLWRSSDGKPIAILRGHSAPVYMAIGTSRRRLLASSSGDRTIKIWNADDGKLVRTFEGHTKGINCIAFMADARFLVSKGDDSIRVWHVDTGTCLAVLPAAGSILWAPGLAVHPTLPRLATVGTATLRHKSARDRGLERHIHIWELDLETLLNVSVPRPISYTSAKVVLVGESNVGKSFLAHRIVTGAPPATGDIRSTHGMTFWPLEPGSLGTSLAAPPDQRRDIVLWDMGGQEEYRLVHQLFLHDTTLALILFDPTRGASAFREVEAWNKYLMKQLRDRRAMKLLVGAKLDHPNNTIDRAAVDTLVKEHGFAGYYETSAITGRGLSEFLSALAAAIDWDDLGKTSRPELFQRIRDAVEARRSRGDIVLHIAELQRVLREKPLTEEEVQAVDAVTAQLAAQGIIAQSRDSSGEKVLVLQVQEIERYAGSLITAARQNPRGVPALELKSVARLDLVLPGLPLKERLSYAVERLVLECTVELLLEHGICFQHEGLLIFPSLFPSMSAALESRPEHAVSLYYDFSGAIDNIYASLIAWLVLARNFGDVRLRADRAEFEVGDNGLCGVYKVARSGGFAHVDVYFEAHTPRDTRDLFISFVEEHLRQNGVEIREHVTVTCNNCGDMFEEDKLRKRIALGAKTVVCSVCETRNDLAEGAGGSRERDPHLTAKTWALKTSIEEQRRKTTEKAVRVLAMTTQSDSKAEPIRVLHLSDLHFKEGVSFKARLQRLADDIRHGDGWGRAGINQLDYLVISGDFTDKGEPKGHDQAFKFVSKLIEEFPSLTAERCIFVPGNHDVRDLDEAYSVRSSVKGLKEGTYVKKDDVYLVQNKRYSERIRSFSDNFYHKVLQQPYPFEVEAQGIAIPFWETGIQFLTFNSAWEIDQFNRHRASVHEDAVAHAVQMAQKQVNEARAAGKLAPGIQPLRIAVWHHAVAGKEQMRQTDFLTSLQQNGVRLLLHGDVHEERRDLFRHWDAKRRLHIVSSGSFGAPVTDRPESTPRLYNLLEIHRDLTGMRVHTRCQSKPEGAWKGWNEWPQLDGGDGGLPYYDITW